MLIDALSDSLDTNLSGDLVIVGAGTVGLFLAAALLSSRRAPFNIILLEAGSKVACTAHNSLSSASVGKPHKGVLMGRASGLGGTSTLWGGQLAEFEEADLRHDHAAWPLSIIELRKYYRLVYEQLGIGEPHPASIYKNKMGGEVDAQGTIDRFFTYWLKEPNFAVHYRNLIKSSAALRVVMNATANDISFDGDKAIRLRCVTDAGRSIDVEANRFLFASGTIPTNRFFLSTQRAGNVPWSRNEYIGSYFQDHLGGKVARVELINEARFRDFFDNGWVNGIKLQPKLALSKDRRQKLKSGACGEFTFDSSISKNVANIKQLIRTMQSGVSFSSAASRMSDIMIVGRSLIPIAARYVRDRRVFSIFDQGVWFNVQAEQIPTSRSRIKLLDADRLKDGLYPVCVDWQCEGDELQAIRDLTIESDAYLQRHGLARLIVDPALIANDHSFLDKLSDTYHQCGGMRMSTSPRAGVVDGDGLVWGTRNVWVTGPALLPSSSHANCTLTGLAMAARLSERLSK